MGFSSTRRPLTRRFRINRWSYPHKGLIYGMRFYSRKLAPAEIAANYAVDSVRFFNSNPPVPCRELVVPRRNANCVLKTGTIITLGGRDGFDADIHKVNVEVVTGNPMYDAEVEWLQGISGNDYIDTGYRPEDTDVISWTGWAKPHESGMDTYVALGFLAYLDEQTETTRIIRNNGSSSSNIAYFRRVAGGGGTVISFDNTIPHDFVLRKNAVSVDGVQYSIGAPSALSENRSNYRIVWSLGSTISRWKLERDGVTLMDAIPVRVGTVGYMYDRVSNRLFGNSGTGAFIVGPDVRTTTTTTTTTSQQLPIFHTVTHSGTNRVVRAYTNGFVNVENGFIKEPTNE